LWAVALLKAEKSAQCVCVCRCVPFDLKWTFAISNSKGTNMFSSKGTANGIGNKGTSIHHLYRKSVKCTSTVFRE